MFQKTKRTDAEEKLIGDPWTRDGAPSALFFTPGPDRLEVRSAGLSVFRILSGPVDLAALRIHPNDIFPGRFPHIGLLQFTELYESMEIGTFGFPTGNRLQETVHAYGSSYSGGHLSQIAPHWGAPPGPDTRFVLDLRATHGNSGGPVFDAEGRVFGVLSGGVPDTRQEQVIDHHPLPEGATVAGPRDQIRDYLNFAQAEPVYPIIPFIEGLARTPTVPPKLAA